MRLLAIIVTVLVLSACGSKTTQPATRSTTATATPMATRPPLRPYGGTRLRQTGQRHTAAGLRRSPTERPRPPAAGRLPASVSPARHRPSRADVRAEQLAGVRDGCAQNTDVRTCVLEAYQTRLVQLALADPATVQPPVVTYECPADTGPLTAQFYNQFAPPTAVLNWKGTQEILFLQPSGSGARYGRQGSEYWEHQGEIKLEFNGTKFVCHTQ